MFSVGGLMVRRDRPSFEFYFPLHLERLMPLLDHLYVRIDRSGGDVLSFLAPYQNKVTWEWQYDHPKNNHLEHKERQAILEWGLSTGAEWMHCFDSDEVLEEGAAEVLRTFIEGNPKYRMIKYLMNYSSHHRENYLLDRDEAGFAAARSFRLSDPELKGWQYVGDEDGLHCGTLPGEHKRSAAILRELYVIHYHALSPEEWDMKRAFYSNTAEVLRNFPDGDLGAYPECGDPPYHCDRFGKESNALPYDDIVNNQQERFDALLRRLQGRGRAA